MRSPGPHGTKKNAVKTAATVTGVAMMPEFHPDSDSADVLLFINQTTTTAQNPATIDGLSQRGGNPSES